jgi:succinoglycan biosynthesis protein ExoA
MRNRSSLTRETPLQELDLPRFLAVNSVNGKRSLSYESDSSMNLEPYNIRPESRRHPLVSAILAVRNEERYIESVLQSLLQQETSECDIEIIVVDGDSSDATREIIERIANRHSSGRLRLLVNHRRRTPYAFNLGIKAARGEYICILGAHTTYAKEYIATCLRELHIHGAGGCSGIEVTRPGSDALQARLAAWVLAHPFGSSTGSMRTRRAGYSDTIPYPIFLKSTLLDVGAYDTQLHRNQDNDLNQRLRARGHKLYITDRTYCEYFVSSTLGALSKYAFNTGFWNIISCKKNRASMSMRHFVPGMFVIILSLCLGTFIFAISAPEHTQLWLRLPLLSLVTAYATASFAAAFHISFREKTAAAFLTPLIFFTLHICYGAGSITAVVINARPPSCDPDLPPEHIE